MRVAFSGTFAARLAGPARARLPVACEVIVEDEEAIVGLLADVDVLVTLAFTRDMGRAARKLRLVQVPGAGLDRIDRSALPSGTLLANAYGHEVGIAEYVLGAILALARDFARLDRALRQGVWESQWAIGAAPPPCWPELAGKTLGILGYGRIGQCVAKRARAFDVRILAMRRNVSQPASGDVLVLGPGALDEVVSQADHLVITLPLTNETLGLIGERELGLMKRHAILVNVSRAAIVVEDALFEALSERRLAGAALDVWYQYPTASGLARPARRPFHELANVLMTPHVSGWTQGMLEARAGIIAENICRIAEGLPPINLIASQQ